MAKKILYKVTAYHCPRCGGVTEPTKKYCDYCSRDLTIRKKDHSNTFRLLIDLGNYIFYDEIMDLSMQERVESIDTTCLEDCRRRIVMSPPTHDFKITIPFTDSGRELISKNYRGIHKIRFEHLGLDQAYETESYIGSSSIDIGKAAVQTITFISTGMETRYDTAIPWEVIKEMRCPNCGAPISFRYGACGYCSGWSEVSW